MQIRKQGFKRPGTQNPLMYYLSVLLYTLINSVLYAAALAPLSALFLFAQGSALQYLALLSPLLLVFILLPLRFSFAQAVTGRYRSMPFSLKIAFSFSLYGEKLAEGFLYFLHMIKWALPLIGTVGTLCYLNTQTDDFTQTVDAMDQFGKAFTTVLKGIGNFFTGMFGGTPNTVSGGFGETIVVILVMIGLCVLLLVWGTVRNSATRYIWAEATELDKNPRFEARRSLRDRRFKQLGVALINLVLLLPVLILLYQLIAPREAVQKIALLYMDLLVEDAELPAVAIPYGSLAILFFVCWLPLTPLRRMITAHFATARLRSLSSAPQPGTGSNLEQTLPLYQDMPVKNRQRS